MGRNLAAPGSIARTADQLSSGCSPRWLSLREPADAVARAEALLDPLRAVLLNRDRVIVRDMGCGTGSMGRWLAARLPGPQHWVLYDRDAALLEVATVTGVAADSTPVTFETRLGELTGLRAEDLAGTSLVTASALLDLLTAEEVDGLAAACAGAGCPALLTLSVSGEVEFAQAEPLDAEFEAAFNDHQRRDGRLGPDAIRAATEAFERRGMRVAGRPSPWRLGLQQAALTEQWLRGWVAAACEQRPELADEAPGYLRRRLAETGGEVVVGHTDLLAIEEPA
ncbi:SAM-dependent methyltransferase [Amycolatopsis taiwanensis]|uniref:SAM-dependent methyltransferase n=1 Tax=Amycolatopsis taiwanensis TaxID=342230 RepID=UPI003CCBD1A1